MKKLLLLVLLLFMFGCGSATTDVVSSDGKKDNDVVSYYYLSTCVCYIEEDTTILGITYLVDSDRKRFKEIEYDLGIGNKPITGCILFSPAEDRLDLGIKYEDTSSMSMRLNDFLPDNFVDYRELVCSIE